jgi:hypothetical protein
VVLDQRTEGHFARRRPQMLGHIQAILDAVERPDSTKTTPRRTASGSFAATWIRDAGCGLS